jgi:hypothetical protein
MQLLCPTTALAPAVAPMNFTMPMASWAKDVLMLVMAMIK